MGVDGGADAGGACALKDGGWMDLIHVLAHEHTHFHHVSMYRCPPQNATDGSLGVRMLLDKAGLESDEATTPAIREYVAVFF